MVNFRRIDGSLRFFSRVPGRGTTINPLPANVCKIKNPSIKTPGENSSFDCFHSNQALPPFSGNQLGDINPPSGSFGLQNYPDFRIDLPRKNENPLWLRGLLKLSKVTMIPWGGLCISGLATPILEGFSSTSLLISVVSGAYLSLLAYDWGYVNDVTKSLQISSRFPGRGVFPKSLPERLNPAITITSLSESPTLVEGSVGSALRAVSHFGKGQVFMLMDSDKLCNRFGKQALAPEWNKRLALRSLISKKIEEVIVGEEHQKEISDYIALGYEMELEATVRQICEKQGLSRAAETKLTNYLGILRTIKETIEFEGIEQIFDPQQRTEAIREVIEKIGTINWLRKKEINNLVKKWAEKRADFIVPDRSELTSTGIERSELNSIFDILRNRIKSEERKEQIGRLGKRIFEGGLSNQERTILACTLANEFPAATCNFRDLLNSLEILRGQANEAASWAVSEFNNIRTSLSQKTKKFMLNQFLEESKFDFKERIRMIIEENFLLHGSTAEAIAVKTVERLFLRYGCENISDFLGRIEKPVLEEIIAETASQYEDRGLSIRLASRIMAECRDIDINISRAAGEFIQWIIQQDRKIQEITSDIRFADDPESLIRVLKLQHPVAGEIIPYLRSYLKNRISARVPLNQVKTEIIDRIPAFLTLSLAERHGIFNFEDSYLQIYRDRNFHTSRKVEMAVSNFRRDWSNINIPDSSIPQILRIFTASLEENKDSREALRKILKLPDKVINALASRVEYELRESALDGLRTTKVNELACGSGNCSQTISEMFDIVSEIHSDIENRHIHSQNKPDNSWDYLKYEIENHGVSFVHRPHNIGGKAGTLGDATGGFGLEARMHNLVHLAIETKLSERGTGHISVHANPRLVTRIDRELCQEFLPNVNPESIFNDIIFGLQRGKNPEEVTKSIMESQNQRNPKLRKKLISIINIFPHRLEERKTSEIAEQIISQCCFPEDAEINGRRVPLAPCLRIAASLADAIIDSSNPIDPPSVEKVMEALKEEVNKKTNNSVSGFLADCLATPLPAVGPQFDVFIQFDGGRHINRDYIFENASYFLTHPSLFLLQTRQHYGRNRWSNPVLIGADSDNDIFYEHIGFAKTHDNAGAPCGSGMVLPRRSWLWGGEWQDELEYRRAGLLGLNKKISHSGGRIYYQIEDSVTEDMASGAKFHKLGYYSIYSPGVYERGKGPPGLKDLLGVQIHRWARGIVGELRMRRPKGSKTTLNYLINNWRSFTSEQRWQYLKSMTYYFSAVSNVISMSAPLAFLLIGSFYPVLNVLVLGVILTRLLVNTWVYPASMKQRGLPLKESFALIGFSLSNWERQLHAAFVTLIKKKPGAFGVSEKEGPVTKADWRTPIGRRLNLGVWPFIAMNSIAFPLGMLGLLVTGNIFLGLWGLVGLYYSTLLYFSWKRYNKGAFPLPPKRGSELLNIVSKSKSLGAVRFAMKELEEQRLAYNFRSIKCARKIYERRLALGFK